ncbi:ABC transporter permease [Spirochaeta thermophila]|uniref:ABC-type transport system, permease component n=1 Tax=Winmispira thermophila (strain ATCC 49972 / DSM 6192 / RI 19.B1) TaxID=665571 RepID=E0RU90_WINT6|nr:ABC transporter permease [Spirochaeta thermophila]ADN02311.1 ABC-type transport system, permease component [Spirochaeta thermophila DSM 6192]
MKAIYKKELLTYFVSPLGYVFMGLFLLTTGFFFATGNLFTRSPEYASFFSSVIMVFLFSAPILTMRLLSEEKNQKTDQLLLTAPVPVWQIVTGKFLAAFTVFALTLLATVVYAVIIEIHGSLPFWETVGSYVGFLLLGGCYIAVGTFISAVTENQITAGLVTFFAILFFILIDSIANALPADATAGAVFAVLLIGALGFYLYSTTRNPLLAAAVLLVGILAIGIGYGVEKSVFERLIQKVLGWFSINKRYQEFGLGIFNVSSLVYYLSFITFFLFITTHALEKRRWS